VCERVLPLTWATFSRHVMIELLNPTNGSILAHGVIKRWWMEAAEALNKTVRRIIHSRLGVGQGVTNKLGLREGLADHNASKGDDERSPFGPDMRPPPPAYTRSSVVVETLGHKEEVELSESEWTRLRALCIERVPGCEEAWGGATATRPRRRGMDDDDDDNEEDQGDQGDDRDIAGPPQSGSRFNKVKINGLPFSRWTAEGQGAGDSSHCCVLQAKASWPGEEKLADFSINPPFDYCRLKYVLSVDLSCDGSEPPVVVASVDRMRDVRVFKASHDNPCMCGYRVVRHCANRDSVFVLARDILPIYVLALPTRKVTQNIDGAGGADADVEYFARAMTEQFKYTR
jgi:hypothetical protein